MKRDLLSLKDFTTGEINQLLELTGRLKQKTDGLNAPLKGKTVALVFQKPSNRTRVSFEVGTLQLGGHCLYLGPSEINLGVRESIADVAQTLSRYLDALVARTYSHQDLMELAQDASIPIINGLSDLYHPCQALADIFSIKERFGKLKGLKLAFIGDGNNVCHSLLLGCAKVGMHMHVATPKKYEPLEDVVRLAKEIAKGTGTQITTDHTPSEAAKDADVIYSDVWVSMGQEDETKKRLKIFKDYQVNQKLVREARKDYIFMHCLPAHRGQEVTADIIDGPHSIVFDQAENRLHVQKAVMIFLLSDNPKEHA